MAKKRKPEPTLLSKLLKAQEQAVHGKPERKPSAPRTKTTFRCCACGLIMTTLVACEKHSLAETHRRIEQVLP